jgi:hypothetical protein
MVNAASSTVRRIILVVASAVLAVLPRGANAGSVGFQEGAVAPTPTPTPSSTPTGFPFNTPTIRCDLIVEPAAPTVGGDVRVTVRRTSNGLGYPEYELEPNAFFVGQTGQRSTATFELLAVQAGSTMLRGSTRDEFIVGYNGDQPFFSFYSASCSAMVEVAPDDSTPTGTPTHTTATTTPTPTATVTSTATRTNPPGSCCGQPSTCRTARFDDCLLATTRGECGGWGDPCSTPAPTPGRTCQEIIGFVSFGELEIEPASPRVGDAVELRFDVRARVFSVEGYALMGAAPLLEEEGQSGTTFQLIALQAGTTTVRLDVRYRTELQCVDGGGNTYFDAGFSRTQSSQDYLIEIAGPPIPSATPTVTASPTTSSDADRVSGGCQLGATGSGDARWSVSWLIIVWIVAVRRYRQRGGAWRSRERWLVR